MLVTNDNGQISLFKHMNEKVKFYNFKIFVMKLRELQ